MRTDIKTGLVAALAAAGTAGGALALSGAGVPFTLGALALAACSGLAVATTLPKPLPPPDPAIAARFAELEAATSTLRHDLRGALSPALMITDRLLASPDPAIVRAGQAVIRSIDRASGLLDATRPTPPARP